jgi:2-aminomuconate deaminase
LSVLFGLYVPPHPHPLLAPNQNEGWGQLRDAYDTARKRIEDSDADIILVYSTTWPSIIGHQIQAHPEPKWVHVDDDFHFLGSMPYEFRMDSEFAESYRDTCEARGLVARTIAYDGFPIDTGSVVALKLLNPDNRIPACIVSSNMYANRAETIVLGKAAQDALAEQGKKAVVVVVSSMSNRMFTKHIEAHEDRIHSQKDEEWNQKILEFFADGRLEDISQLSREIHGQIRVQKVVAYKPAWWMAAVMGQHNNYHGEVLAYAALHGSGGAVIQLTPTADSVGDKEFDEDDVDVYRGDRNVLVTGARDIDAAAGVKEDDTTAKKGSGKSKNRPKVSSRPSENVIHTSDAPTPVGAYPHARKVGDLLYLSGVGPRQPDTDEIPGGPIEDKKGKPRDYDIKAQTKACIENVRTILEASGSSLDDVLDVTAFLVDMKRDFKGYNKIYADYFEPIQATRTTLAVSALPTPIAVELKVIARAH